MSGIPRSLWIGNSCCYDPLMRVWGKLGKQTAALHAPRRSHLESKRSTYNEYTLEERVKMERYGTENGPSKVAFRWQAECRLMSWLHHF